jgi:hypothetical protein
MLFILQYVLSVSLLPVRTLMLGLEVFVGEITSNADRSRTISNNKIITGHGQSGVVEGIALTQFHVLTLHSNFIAATCLLNNQLVFLDEFDKRTVMQNTIYNRVWRILQGI